MANVPSIEVGFEGLAPPNRMERRKQEKFQRSNDESVRGKDRRAARARNARVSNIANRPERVGW